jgi:hypothetical protein
VGGVVLLQATLTFIGLGGGSVWGSMLSQGRNWVIGAGGSLLRYWWVFLPPTIAVMVFGIAWNILGDGLNDILDPALRDTFYRQSSRKSRKDKTASPSQGELPGPIATSLPHAGAIAGEQVLFSRPVEQAVHSDGASSVLLAARDHLANGDLSRSLHAYHHLIQRNRLMDDVLPDLAQLIKKIPHDPQVWQTMGDALARAGDAEHATQSYDRARKLTQ